ncbi:MAG TPA: hypothetical protein VEI03_02980 [Stellaceae bacterium]|nr:hypothetical protein [Stellaceae bacterium]
MHSEPAAREEDKTGGDRVGRLLTLWIVASGLWTVATVLRVYRVWVPGVGWWKLVGGPWLWASLILPPVMFAVVLAAIHRIRRGRK